MDPHTLQIIIGLRIVESRWNIGLEQQELAEMCDYEKTYLSRIEHGKSSVELKTINRIAEKLSKPTWQLMKPWKNCEKKIKVLQFMVKKYRGHLPPSVKKKKRKK